MESVGRAGEREALSRALEPPGAKVALVGPGGAGKTHLARGLRDARFCDLTGCRGRTDVFARLAQAAGVTLRGSGDTPSLARALAGRTTVLDGCEPVLDAVQDVLDCWEGDGRLVLTTRVRPQRTDVVLVGPMTLPAEPTLDAVLRSEAGQLFVAAARRARPGWTPEPDEGPALAELLRRLDGLPLALGLAAARLRVVGTRQLVELLTERFRLLQGEEGSLEAVIEASWDLLTDADRELLVGLSWFGAGFDLEAVTSMDGVGDPLAAVDRLQGLVDHSLLHAWELEALPGVRWYSLYDSVRAFARSRSAGGPPSRGPWLSRRAHGLLPMLRGRSWRDAAERLAAMAPDLRVAFDEAEAAGDGETAGRAALALDGVLKSRGPASAREPLVRRALALGGALADDVLLAGLDGGALPPDPSTLRAVARRAGDLAPRRARALRILARELAIHGDPTEARTAAEEAVALDPDDPRVWVALADVLGQHGEADAAVAANERAFAVARRNGADRDAASVLAMQAILQNQLNRPDEALDLIQRALQILDAIDDPRPAAIYAQLLGDVPLERRDAVGAERGYTEALHRLGHVQEVRWRAACEAGIAMARAEAGELEHARVRLRAALRDARAVDPPRLQGFVACWSAVIEAFTGHPDIAVDRLGAADTRIPQVADAVWVASRAVDLARAEQLRADGDIAGADALAVHAQGLLAAADRARWVVEARVAARWADAMAARQARPDVVDVSVARDGSWFEVPGADRVSLATRRNNRRVLERLIDAHLAGRAADVDELLEAGWPGERVLADAGAARVYTAVATLRREGLKDVLERTETGYAFRADAVVRVVQGAG